MSEKSIQKFIFGPWELITCKKSIATSEEYDKIAKNVKIPNIPEILFSNNYLKLTNTQLGGLNLFLSSIDSLNYIENQPINYKVAASEQWNLLNNSENYKSSRPFDWTFYSTYSGTLKNGNNNETFIINETNEPLDIALLSSPSNIIFFDKIDFYEDELGDHGISFLNRCMSHSIFILMRSFVRIDKVAYRVFETRFHLKVYK